MPKPSAILTRAEASEALRAHGFRYSVSALSRFASEGKGAPFAYQKHPPGRKGRPIVVYIWSELAAWALARERELRPWNTAIKVIRAA